MRLIDADAYKAKMKEKQDECAKWRDEAKARPEDDVHYTANGVLSAFIEAKLTLDKMPTIDAVEVVRCKDCEYWQADNFEVKGYGWRCGNLNTVTKPIFFCGYGVKQTEKG